MLFRDGIFHQKSEPVPVQLMLDDVVFTARHYFVSGKGV
jgi:hypothetical protein